MSALEAEGDEAEAVGNTVGVGKEAILEGPRAIKIMIAIKTIKTIPTTTIALLDIFNLLLTSGDFAPQCGHYLP